MSQRRNVPRPKERSDHGMVCEACNLWPTVLTRFRGRLLCARCLLAAEPTKC